MSALRSAAKPENPVNDLCSDLQERALEQHSVAMLLRALFLSMADDDDGPLHHYKQDLWEGLAVIARHISSDGKEISNMVDEIRTHVDKGGVR